MFAVYQTGYAIYGIGATAVRAIQDAAAWLDADTDLCTITVYAPSGPQGEERGQLSARPCTARLALEVQEHGGDCRYEINADGLLDLEP